MQITVLAIGSRGDVQPLVALGAGLQRAGHVVRLVAGDDFETLASGHGLEFVPLGVEIKPLLESAQNIFAVMNTLTQPIVAACQDADAIVATFMGIAGLWRRQGTRNPVLLCAAHPIPANGRFSRPRFSPAATGQRL